MKNRKLLLIVSLVLALTMSLGGTLAYLTDTDADVNVMVLGNVKIEQHEYQRAKNEDGSFKKGTVEEQDSYVLEDFDQNKPLLPTTEVDENGKPVNWGAGNWDETIVLMSQVDSYGDMKVFKSPLAVDKFVTVENTGKTAAYVRTFIAFESGAKDYDAWEDLVGINCNMKVWKMTEIGIVEINGNNYNVKEFVYLGSEGVRHENGILPAGETTYPSLSQIYLDSRADNEDMVEFDGNANGTFDILVLSQAIQADGFANADVAFKASFNNGADTVTADMVAAWFEGEDAVNELPVIKTVSTAADLADALNNVNSDTTIVLANDIMEAGSLTYYQAVDRAVTIDGNGYKYEGIIMVNGKSAGIDSSALTIQDVNFVGRTKTDAEDAYIMLGKSGDSNTRYTRNVTITNCTFEGDGMVAVKSYTGGDKKLVIENCTVKAGMHSLCQLANVEEGLEIRGCKVSSKNGANLNQTVTALIEDCTFDVQGYAVRFGAAKGNVATNAEQFEIVNSTLKSACAEEEDAVIEVRLTAQNATITLTNTTVAGSTKISGVTEATTVNGLN